MMRRIAEIFGVVALVAIYGGMLVKQHIEFEKEWEQINKGKTFTFEERDTSSMCPLEESCLAEYKNLTFADTARVLKSIYDEREMISSTAQIICNALEEVGVRMRIVELEREKLDAVLPQHMRGGLSWANLQRFLDITEAYYHKLYGEDPWNFVSALDDTIRELKQWAETERREYQDAMEAYHGNDSNDNNTSSPDDI